MLLALGTPRVPGKGANRFDKPTDVAVHPRSREVYVADGYGNSRVAVFSYTGQYLREFGEAGSGPGQFRVPHGLAIDKRGDVYVADRENSRVQVFTAAGTHKATWVSRVATAVGRQSFTRHVSSVFYHEGLDLFAVSAGGAHHTHSVLACGSHANEAGGPRTSSP